MRTRPYGSGKTSPFAGKNSNGTYFYLPINQPYKNTNKNTKNTNKNKKKTNLFRSDPFV